MPLTAEAVRALELCSVAHEIEQAIIAMANAPRFVAETIHGTPVVWDTRSGTAHIYCQHPFVIDGAIYKPHD